MTREELCADQDMQVLMSELETAGTGILPKLDGLLDVHPRDARLHFLKGSILVGTGKLIEAHACLSRAVDIAPDFAIARFQLGFFQLTSGEANNAVATWQPLDALEDGHYLKLFVQGLRHLIKDEFEPAFSLLRQGMDMNEENPPLNNDMQLLIDQCQALDNTRAEVPEPTVPPLPEPESVSATSLILGQLLGRKKKRSN